jgi:DNA-binding transcriptional LysR family regulator
LLTYEELQYFAAFAKYGTLSEVAEKYLISQPTVTRAMKKAEDVFGIPLFNRTKNSISLNENGKLAAEEIRLLLKQTDEMIERVRAYDRANRTISIGTSAAVELPGLIGRISHAFPEKAISTESGLPEDLEKGLEKGTYQLIVLPYEPESDEWYAKPIGEEHLMFYLPKNHKYARRKKLKLIDLNGENLLLFSDIGFWADIVRKKMPDSRFLVQSERYTFRELIENSLLPCFATDITVGGMNSDEIGRVAVPIEDPEVNVTYYLTCKKSMKKQLQAVFTS